MNRTNLTAPDQQDGGRRPSSRTLDPLRWRHLDDDQPLQPSTYDLGLRQWSSPVPPAS